MIVGTEWLIEAADCDPEKLRDENMLRAVFARVVADLDLKVIDSVWHKFPGEGGVTGLAALTESHLACHTYPEHRTATFNLYCCRTRPEWDWKSELRAAIWALSCFCFEDRAGLGRPTISQSKAAGGEHERPCRKLPVLRWPDRVQGRFDDGARLPVLQIGSGAN